MKLAIVGSRSFTDYALLETEALRLSPSEVVSGGASGADSLAEKFADSNGIDKRIFLPKFKTDSATKYHPRWYLKRNMEIVDYADHILAFSNGSKGTSHTIKYAMKQGKPVTLKPF